MPNFMHYWSRHNAPAYKHFLPGLLHWMRTIKMSSLEPPGPSPHFVVVSTFKCPMSTPTQHKIRVKIQDFLSATMVRIPCWFSAKIPLNIWKFAQGVKYRFAGPSAQWGALGGCKFGRFHQWGQGQFARVGEKNKDASTRCRRKVREEQNADC